MAMQFVKSMPFIAPLREGAPAFIAGANTERHHSRIALDCREISRSSFDAVAFDDAGAGGTIDADIMRILDV